MITRLTRHEGQWALTLSEDIQKSWGVPMNLPMKIDVDGNCLLVTPIQDDHRRQAFESALDHVNHTFDALLKDLAG